MTTFAIPTMRCAQCVKAVTQAAQEVDPAATVEIDLSRRTCRVESEAGPAALQASWSKAGYESMIVGD